MYILVYQCISFQKVLFINKHHFPAIFRLRWPRYDSCTALAWDPRVKPTLFSGSCTTLTWDPRVKPTFLFGSCTTLTWNPRVKPTSLYHIAASAPRRP